MSASCPLIDIFIGVVAAHCNIALRINKRVNKADMLEVHVRTFFYSYA